MSGVINSAGSKSGEIGTTELDYEEGTWTPALVNGSSTASYTDAGSYTKIGNKVFFRWYSSSVTISSASGDAEISGLPFTSDNNNWTFQAEHTNGVDGDTRGGIVLGSNDRVRFLDKNSASGATYVNGSGKFLMISVSYTTDA